MAISRGAVRPAVDKSSYPSARRSCICRSTVLTSIRSNSDSPSSKACSGPLGEHYVRQGKIRTYVVPAFSGGPDADPQHPLFAVVGSDIPLH